MPLFLIQQALLLWILKKKKNILSFKKHMIKKTTDPYRREHLPSSLGNR
jgi:hypothetical protein